MQQLARLDTEPKRPEAELCLGRHAGAPFVNRRSYPTSYAAVAYCLSVCMPIGLGDVPPSNRRSDPPFLRYHDTTGSGQLLVISKRRVRHAGGSLTFAHSLGTLRQCHSRQRFILYGARDRIELATRGFQSMFQNALSL